VLESILTAAATAAVTGLISIAAGRLSRRGQTDKPGTVSRASSSTLTFRVTVPQQASPPRRRPPRPHSVLEAGFAALWRLLDRLPPVRHATRPWLAGLIGFLTVGIGTAIYLRTRVDVFVGLALAALIGATVQGPDENPTLPWWAWPLVALSGVYAYLRSLRSNVRLEPEVERTTVADARPE
jgi:hypothetical protein